MAVLLCIIAVCAAYGWQDPNHSTSVMILPFSESTTNVTDDVSNISTNDGDIQYGTSREPLWTAASNTHAAFYTFDGANDQILATNTASLDVLGKTNVDFTVSVWFRTTNSFSGQWIMAKAGPSSASSSYPFTLRILSNDRARLWAYNGTIGGGPVSTGAVNNGVWHMITAVRDYGAGYLLYIDGVEQGRRSDSLGDTSNPDKVSIGNGGGSNYWNKPYTGDIYRPTIYTNVISSNDIYQMYLNTHPTNYVQQTGTIINF